MIFMILKFPKVR